VRTPVTPLALLLFLAAGGLAASQGPLPGAGANVAPATPPVSVAALPQQAPRRFAPAGPCAERDLSDLYCLDLHATPEVQGASGAVELGRPASPFAVAVTAAGTHVHELAAHIDGLPAPQSLGPYTTYVAWATTPFFEPVVKLGEVTNGANALGRVAFNKFLVLITAEASGDVRERTGRLVLRGRSPSLLMDPHDLMTQAPSAVLGPLNRDAGGSGRVPADARGGMRMGASGGNRGDRADNAAATAEATPGAATAAPPPAGSWEMPPMHPLVPMLPGMAGLVPVPLPHRLVPTAGLDSVPASRPGAVIDLPDGGTLDLRAGVVRHRIGDSWTLMMAFNGQHPGPMIRVAQGSTIFVNFTNDTAYPTSVHWHGVRLDNRFDGVPGVTQEPVMPGETFRYRIHFRDAGIYWYHPHHREDIQQEYGLYGNMLVDAPRSDYFGPVNREQILMLDDILVEAGGGVVPFGAESANYMLMGRFGNEFLVNGEPLYELDVDRGEVVRFYLTNASNTRTYNLSFQREEGPPRDARAEYTADGTVQRVPDAPLSIKVVGSDVGKFEREVKVESVVVAPAERYVVEVRFDEPGTIYINNQVQAINHRYGTFFPEVDTLGVIRVADRPASDDHGPAFDELRVNADVIGDIDGYRERFDDPIDRELLLTLEARNLPLPVQQVMLYDWIYFNPVEWSGTMPMMNWLSSGSEVTWMLRDVTSGAVNTDIDWSFRVGDVVKIRLRNDRNAWHAMQHPLHIHGQRFLVLEQDGVANDNLVWKDTVLLPTGTTTDILLELSNPGRWMVHCHIAEHLESGMKFVFEVEPEGPQGGTER
jgi:FtsP/CotA-like multicopper oxidase with cupredoxin domain